MNRVQRSVAEVRFRFGSGTFTQNLNLNRKTFVEPNIEPEPNPVNRFTRFGSGSDRSSTELRKGRSNGFIFCGCGMLTLSYPSVSNVIWIRAKIALKCRQNVVKLAVLH